MAARGGASNMGELDSNLHILKNLLRGHADTDMTENVAEVAQNVAEYCSDDEELKQRVRAVMLECLEMENEIQHHIAALNHIKSLSPDTPNLVHLFENQLTELREAESDPLQHPKYVTMVQKMSETSDADDQLASLKATLLGASQDDDVEMTQGDINIKCPYSGQVMVTPMINTKCKHVYDREPILEYIMSRKNRAKCPVGGCGNNRPIQASHLKEHKDLKKYISLLSKQQQQR